MKYKVKLDKMTAEEIYKKYGNIKVIVRDKRNRSAFYLRKPSLEEAIGYKFLLENEENYGDIVDFGRISELDFVRMLSPYRMIVEFKPNFIDTIRQIPPKYIDQVEAIEIIDYVKDAMGFKWFSSEFSNNYLVYLVKLYKKY